MIFKILFLLVVFCSIGCAQNLAIVWEYPADADTAAIYFDVYVWQADSADIDSFDVSQFDSIATVPYVLGQTIYQYRYDFQEDKVIRAGLIARDAIRNSGWEMTRFYGFTKKPRNSEILKF